MSTAPTVRNLTPQEVTEHTTQVENLQTHFFNHCRVVMGFYDVRIYIGEAVPLPNGEPRFVEKLCLVTSPEYAQTFLDMVLKLLPQYETTFGKIRKPPAVQQPAAAPQRRK